MDKSYLLAITPPKSIIERVDEYRRKYRKHTYSINPHITIYPPFYLDKISTEELFLKLSNELSRFPRNEICLDSIGFFENGNDKNVAFFKPDGNSSDYLRKVFSLCSNCIKDFVSNKYDYHFEERNYSPHMTISSNIPDNIFPQIKSELEDIKDCFKFNLKSVDVYEQGGNGGIWTKIKEL